HQGGDRTRRAAPRRGGGGGAGAGLQPDRGPAVAAARQRAGRAVRGGAVHPVGDPPATDPRGAIPAAVSCASSGAAPRRLSISRCGTTGGSSTLILLMYASKSASLPASLGRPRAVSRSCRVAASDRTHTSRTGGPPSSSTQRAHRPASCTSLVNGPSSMTGQPCSRIRRAVAVMPAYSCRLTCSSYQAPSRSPCGLPWARSTSPTKPPYRVSLSSRAGTGDRRASSAAATVDLPAPGGPLTTQIMTSVLQ